MRPVKLSRVIRRVTGLTVPEFCTKYLNTNFKAFQYRVRVQRLAPNEIILLSWVLGEPVEGLFGKQFLSLMQGQGDPEIEKRLLKMYRDADDTQKQRLMGLLDGISFKAVPQEPVNKLKADEVALVPVADFYIDVQVHR